MKKITLLLLSSILLLGTVACDNNAKTSSNAPDSPAESGKVVTDKTVQTDKKDATSQVRRDQLNADIRAREQRNLTGGGADRANADLASEVRSKLEANIPAGQLTVTAKDGAVVVSGTVQIQEQLNKIDSLAKQIKGVKSVKVLARVSPSVPNEKR
ncbi:BON domain-containing protein [Dolichospermum sp. ST_sed1]|nr:BON domain-containing protein [Dolichospermum sp. ST_sed1]MDD1426774.1 BON domain-containing protein [Dolichospermum sp. ST_sed9]MDD1433826.1 BON domain-containing protein [Dolichospermum sp. ST_sed6]MDD1436471.1 BON domain-containing protein [Dolichospermum sp. ST_sed10]MDD1439649.1 BON domain-containing protein [Dolichospermum sp. ST_sed3]MDD1449268.1 BON domain-containing protein [Dolichospermum sp. ST_sed8]MDD1458092.1 BON domain-containing protein [Dolichospermum sp. ST_sed7]MDD14633